jgi:ribosomal protein S18 acetylase RimI-like enzyme
MARSRRKVTVRAVKEDDWPALRELRLAALRTDPLAFGSTIDREERYPPEHWQERARQASGSRAVTVVAEENAGGLAGMGGIFSDGESFHAWGMWVRPERRRLGLGAAILDALLDWLAQRFPGASLLLEVNPLQEAAVRLYRSRGFEPTGVERSLGHDPPAIAIEMLRRPSRRGEAQLIAPPTDVSAGK